MTEGLGQLDSPGTLGFTDSPPGRLGPLPEPQRYLDCFPSAFSPCAAPSSLSCSLVPCRLPLPLTGAARSLAHLHCITVWLEGDPASPQGWWRGTAGRAACGPGAGSEELPSRPRQKAQLYPLCPGTGPGALSTDRTGALIEGWSAHKHW